MILYKQGASGLTGRALARALGMKAWPPERSRASVPLLLRWGNDTPNVTGKREFNPRDAVALARNKEAALKAMAAAGVRVPAFTTTAPAIGRTRYHQGGEGLTVWRTGPMPRDCAYFLEIINKKSEFRVHVVSGEVIYTQRKVATETCTDDLIRNHNNGWRFVRILTRPNLNKIALAAVKALGLDYGAVDVLLSTDGKFYVVEVNTAPRLEGSTFDAWITALRAMLAAR